MLVLLALLLSAPKERFPTSVDWENAPNIVKEAQEWRERDPIPEGLARFQVTGGCFGSPTDTGQLLSQIENLPLLVRLVLDPDVDEEVSEEAYQYGLYRAGPNRFFRLLQSRWPRREEPPTSPRYVEIRRLMGLRHVVVDGLDSRHEDMSVEEANAVMDRIERELRRGAPWKQTLENFADEFGYRTGNTTKVGNLGDFVVFDDEATKLERHQIREDDAIVFKGEILPRRMSRLSFMPMAHIAPLLNARKGDVIRLDDPDMRALDLYQVREVYEGVSTVPSH